MDLAPGVRLDMHELISPLGAGGMGEVWLARDIRLERMVALKLLPAALTQDSSRLARFQREARAASALNHPNICTIYALGDTQDGRLYLSMEYVDGETLRRRLGEEPLSVADALAIACAMASALAAAHAHGIVHRDIKPENVMLRRDGGVKMLDFGLAKLSAPDDSSLERTTTLDEGHTQPGAVMGTPAYMSPEQARGEPVDYRTDIWSLGIVLFEMVTGIVPFRGRSSSDVLVAILDREPPPLARFDPDAPSELQRITSKALRKSADEPYQSAKDLLLDLQTLRDEVKGLTPAPADLLLDTPAPIRARAAGTAARASATPGAPRQDECRARAGQSPKMARASRHPTSRPTDVASPTRSNAKVRRETNCGLRTSRPAAIRCLSRMDGAARVRDGRPTASSSPTRASSATTRVGSSR